MTLTPKKKKNHIFLASCIPASKFASLEHNCNIFGTGRPHLWNTIATSLEHTHHIVGAKHAGRVERSQITTLRP